MNHLSFGYNDGLVPELTAAWGARMIVTQDGHVDLLWDRQSFFGDDVNVRTWLNGGALTEAITNIKRLLREGVIDTRKAFPFVLHMDFTGAVIGNTNASAGYLYVAAWVYSDLPDGHGTRGLERVDQLARELEATT